MPLKAQNRPRARPAEAKADIGLASTRYAKFLILIGIFLFIVPKQVEQTEAAESGSRATLESVTYSKDIASILFQNCVSCHRPGQSAPFELRTFADAEKHARDIAAVTAKHIMPPWLPLPGYNDFRDERRLTDAQIAIVQEWVEQGAPEGDPKDLPPLPKFASTWQLGKPDLVVEPSSAYVLPAEGKDIYFDFVIPTLLMRSQYVSAIELLPDTRALHHAFIEIDPTAASRRKAAASLGMGFFGMDLPETVSMPDGQLLGWQPGKIPSAATQGLVWLLRTNVDLVVQTHLNPQGKSENVRPRLGFHFTDQAPTNSAFRLRLTTLELDIPPGGSNYLAETSYTLPVDLSFVRVGAHAHYLCKEMQSYAILPDGQKKWLLFIKDWDFKWQGDYEYKRPVELPRGTTVFMRFTYDNSTNNLRNPFSPPKRTFHGPQTTDEMGEMYFQTVPRSMKEGKTLADDYRAHDARVHISYYQFRLGLNPRDSEALIKEGRALASIGRISEAVAQLEAAARYDPTNDLPHFDLGSIYLRDGRARRAYQEFSKVVQLNPQDSEAQLNLGIICAQSGKLEEAREHLRETLRIDPLNQISQAYLDRLGTQN